MQSQHAGGRNAAFGLGQSRCSNPERLRSAPRPEADHRAPRALPDRRGPVAGSQDPLETATWPDLGLEGPSELGLPESGLTAVLSIEEVAAMLDLDQDEVRRNFEVFGQPDDESILTRDVLEFLAWSEI